MGVMTKEMFVINPRTQRERKASYTDFCKNSLHFGLLSELSMSEDDDEHIQWNKKRDCAL